MIMIHSRNIDPTRPSANTACQLWHILLCSNHDRVCSDWPVGFELKTCWLQLDETPEGPQSSTDTTIRPTNQRTNNMKPPIMTIEGRSRRWKMSHSNNPMKMMQMAETVM